ncbi:MAG: alpha-hydroxy-acid oxidizing protein [Pseudolabrys sp.]|nr:alpha-hydroxy-acid oxidizing protein [Pseudolabrys sp.]
MDTVDFDALEGKAKAAMPPPSWAFCVTGADDEITATENVTAWRNLRLRPRVLNDVANASIETTLLGHKVASPILIAPTGRHKLFHAEGEVQTARGAAMANALYVMAHSANVTVEDVAKERKTAPQWFQLYLHPDHKEMEKLLDRVASLGFTAVSLTVDNQLYGASPIASRTPYTPTEAIRSMNFPGQPVMRHGYDPSFAGKMQFPTTWRDLEWLVKRSPLPMIVKGVMRGDDALRCVEIGAKAIQISNHGGRHLDTSIPTVEALREIAPLLKDKAEVYVDGGIRRGTDVVKALALGAKAVLVGRPPIWGLATGGAQGVADVMTHLNDELLRAMRLCGLSSVADASPDLVA